MSKNLRSFIRDLIPSLQQGPDISELDDETRLMLDRALEIIVSGTDSNINLVPGYKDKLNNSIIKALQYINQVIEQIAEPVEICKDNLHDNPYAHALFYTQHGLNSVFHKSSELREFFEEPKYRTEKQSCAMLCMKKKEEVIFGMQLKGDFIVKNVKQTKVSFIDQHILSPANNEQTARRELKCCLFEGLVDNALANISEMRAKRCALETRQKRLSSGLRSYKIRTHGQEGDTQYLKKEKKLDEVKKELASLGYVTPQVSLAQVDEVLSCPEDFISLKNKTVNLDRDGILKEDTEDSSQVNKLRFSEVSIKGQPTRVVMLVNVHRDDMEFSGIRFPEII